MARCDDCGTDRPKLHRHHLKPQVLGGTDEDGIVFLCGNCHDLRHGGPCGGTLRGTNSNTPEARAKKSATLKAQRADPEWRAQQSARLTAFFSTEEGRAIQRENNRKRYSDPAQRQRQSEALREYWANRTPDERAAQVRAMNEARHPPRSDP